MKKLILKKRKKLIKVSNTNEKLEPQKTCSHSSFHRIWPGGGYFICRCCQCHEEWREDRGCHLYL